MRILLAIVAIMALAGEVSAAEPLLSSVRYEDKGDYAQLEIRLGVQIEIAGDPEVEADSLRFQLTPVGDSRLKGWSSAEMSFDEADRLLKRVMIEGDGRRGYELVVDFTESVTAQLLPQFDDQQVLIKLASNRAHRKTSRFGEPEIKDHYAINLESRHASQPELRDIPRAFADSHSVYITEFEKDGVLWHRLRLGFFATEQKAEVTVAALRRYFPDAWVVPVAESEVRFAKSFQINPEDQVARFSPKSAVPPQSAVQPAADVLARIQLITPSTIGAVSEPKASTPRWQDRQPIKPAPLSEAERLAAEARSAFEAQDYGLAIRLYTKLMGLATGEIKQQALEMLGASRELNRQLAHAKSLYKAYLHEYPDTEGALRVQQRLAGLMALERTPKTALKQIASKDSQTWNVSNHLSQFYQRHSLKVDDNSSIPIHGLFSDYNMMARKGGASLDQEARVTMSYLLDFSGQERLKGREFQISSAYWEGFSDRFNSGVKVGRQSRLRSGVPGRFDGASFTYQRTANLAIDLTGGFLVDSSFDAPSTNRPFLGVSGEYISKSGNITIEPFFMQQYVDGILDRRAVGIQAQLFTERAMIYTLLDYDIHHSALNNVTFSGNYRFRSSRLSASFEHRKSPYLTTRNALIGQSFGDLSDLEQAILDLELKDIANDRTATSDTIRVGVSTNLSDHWSITADVIASDFSKTESSADVSGLESQRTLYSSFQVRTTDIFGQSSFSALMLRRAESGSGATTSLYWDNRFSLGDSWRIYPRLRLDRRSFDRTGDKQWSVRPSMRLDYRPSRRLRFEFETGYLRTTRTMVNRDLDISGFFVRAGYRASF